MLTEETIRVRIAVLRVIDVSLLLKNALPDIEAVLNSSRHERASEMIDVWEIALGGDLKSLHGMIDRVRGQTGYIRALAAFSRSQEYRALGMTNFGRAVVLGSRRALARWSWVPGAYRCRVEEFASQRLQRMRNIGLASSLSNRAKESSLKQFRVLRELMEGYKSVRDQFVDYPTFHAARFKRMEAVLDEGDRLVIERAQRVVERDAIKARIESLGTDRSILSRIGRLPSLEAQILAYGDLITDEQRCTLQVMAEQQAARLNEELHKFASTETQSPVGQHLGELTRLLRSPA